MTDRKLNQAYGHPDYLQTGSKAVKKLHKITYILKNDVGKSCKLVVTKKTLGKFIYYRLKQTKEILTYTLNQRVLA